MKPEQLDEIERLAIACDKYGYQSSPKTVLSLIAEVKRLSAREEKYQQVCAAAYQMAGTVNAPVRFLDALSDASCGEFETRGKIEDLLPVTPDETGCFLSDQGEEFRDDAERYDFVRSRAELREYNMGHYWYIKTIDVPMGMPMIDATLANVIDAHRKESPNAND